MFAPCLWDGNNYPYRSNSSSLLERKNFTHLVGKNLMASSNTPHLPTKKAPKKEIRKTGSGSKYFYSWLFYSIFSMILLVQVFICFHGIAAQWTRGHNGWNGSAYHLSARNTLRWGSLFPVQYYTGRTPPSIDMVYTHHPLAMHLHNSASLWVFGDQEWAVRSVPALHGVLAVLMLMLVLRRFFGSKKALLAGGIYTILPINGIYANMMNHSSGFIFWCLLAFYCYLRFQENREPKAIKIPDKKRQSSKFTVTSTIKRAFKASEKIDSGPEEEIKPTNTTKWYLGLLITFFMASSWDWPAYYMAFAIAVHWFIVGIKRQVRTRRWLPGKGFWLFSLYSAWVLALFAGHFFLVRVIVGSWEELVNTFGKRQGVTWERFSEHLQVVPELMFTKTILVMCCIWLIICFLRIVTGRFRRGDLIPLAFAFGGSIHFYVFKWSAIVHSYWAWTLLPFVAIACADLIVETSHWLRLGFNWLLGLRFKGRWVGITALIMSLSTVFLLYPLVNRSIDLIPKGRSVGGSIWFVEPVRGPVNQKYISGRAELRFARQVRKWTTRGTGVLIHNSFKYLRPECRFDITLDREIQYVKNVPYAPDSRFGITDGWVFIGRHKATNRRKIVQLAAGHPYYQHGDFFMVDLRRHKSEIFIWKLVPQPVTKTWWFLHSAWEDPVAAVRQKDKEAKLQAEVDLFLEQYSSTTFVDTRTQL